MQVFRETTAIMPSLLETEKKAEIITTHEIINESDLCFEIIPEELERWCTNLNLSPVNMSDRQRDSPQCLLGYG